MVHPDDIERAENEIANQIYASEDCLDRVKYRIIRKDGAVRIIDDIGRKVFTENGSSVFYVCIADVTDPAQANEWYQWADDTCGLLRRMNGITFHAYRFISNRSV